MKQYQTIPPENRIIAFEAGKSGELPWLAFSRHGKGQVCVGAHGDPVLTRDNVKDLVAALYKFLRETSRAK